MTRAPFFGFVWAALSVLSALVAGWLYYLIYWRWRDCFNEEGRCFIAQSAVVLHESTGPIYLSLAILSILSACAGMAVGLRLRKKDKELGS